MKPLPEDAVVFDSHNGYYRLRARQRLPGSRADVFAFFSDALQLENITPAWLRFQVLTPGPIHLEQGSLLDYKLKIHGVPIKWRTRISIWEPDVRFVDEQIRGPYRLWEHEHVFEEQGGQTTVHDEIRYKVPGGAIIHQLFVKRDLDRIFQFRLATLKNIFAA